MRKMVESDRLLRIGQACRLLGVSHQTVRNWSAAGLLTPVRLPLSGHRRFRLEDVQLVANRMTGRLANDGDLVQDCAG